MKPAQIADKVNEGMDSLAPTFFVSETGAKTIDDLQREIVSTIEEVAGDPDEYSMWTVATNLISKVRAYLIVDAELPENPFHITLGTAKLAPFEHGIQHGRREGYERCKKDVKAAGWRKVKEARE